MFSSFSAETWWISSVCNLSDYNKISYNQLNYNLIQEKKF